jgi:hypothetical protein
MKTSNAKASKDVHINMCDALLAYDHLTTTDEKQEFAEVVVDWVADIIANDATDAEDLVRQLREFANNAWGIFRQLREIEGEESFEGMGDGEGMGEGKIGAQRSNGTRKRPEPDQE